ncbi:MAG: biopolymer transporter ExbD [Nibricoccus sp.]
MNDVFYTPLRKKARVEIIPLIDVVFFLLATFVLFTLSLDKIGSLPTPFAKAGERIPFMEDQTLYLQTTARGLFAWKIGRDSPVEYLSRAELGPRLETYKRSVASPRVSINGDDLAPFTATIEALDAVRLAKIPEIALETARN